MAVSFSRTTIFCRSIERSLALYRDALGFEVIDDKTLEGPAAGALLNIGPCSLRIVLLGDSTDQQPVIGLFQISDTEIPSLPLPPQTMALGQTATVIETDQFDAVVDRLRETDASFLTEPLEYPKKNASPGSPAGIYKEAICFDPDGNLVSILQVVPIANH